MELCLFVSSNLHRIGVCVYLITGVITGYTNFRTTCQIFNQLVVSVYVFGKKKCSVILAFLYFPCLNWKLDITVSEKFNRSFLCAWKSLQKQRFYLTTMICRQRWQGRTTCHWWQLPLSSSAPERWNHYVPPCQFCPFSAVFFYLLIDKITHSIYIIFLNLCKMKKIPLCWNMISKFQQMWKTVGCVFFSFFFRSIFHT